MRKKLSTDSLDDLIECFQFVEDPRVKGRSRHLLIDIIVLSICAMLSGAEGVTEIELFGLQKIDWLRRYLRLPCGIPSHDTIGRVLSLVDPAAMEVAFANWVEATIDHSKTKTISLDGKSVVGTERNLVRRFEQLHLVSAYSHELGLSLAQTQANGRGMGETKAVTECLDLLDLDGVTVMVDAGAANKIVIHKIRERKAHYLVPIKGNNKISKAEIDELFVSYAAQLKNVVLKETAHGREEKRTCHILPASVVLSEAFKEKWIDVQSVFAITRNRIEPDKRPFHHRVDERGVRHFEKNERTLREKSETTYYVSSRKLTPEKALNEARRHWGIENNLHWVLDVAFREDDWMVRAKSLARSLSALRKVVFNLVKSSSIKGSVRSKIKRAAWSDDFLAELVFGKRAV